MRAGARMFVLAEPPAEPERQIQPRIDDVERVAVEPAFGKRHQQPHAVAVGEVHEDVQQHAEVRQQQDLRRHRRDRRARLFSG